MTKNRKGVNSAAADLTVDVVTHACLHKQMHAHQQTHGCCSFSDSFGTKRRKPPVTSW